jgi:hypothetical protein
MLSTFEISAVHVNLGVHFLCAYFSSKGTLVYIELASYR